MQAGHRSTAADSWMRFHLSLSALILGSWAATLASLRFTHSQIDWLHLAETVRSSFVICAPLIFLVALYRWLPYLSRCAVLLIWAWVVNIAFEVPILAAARFHLPLRDAQLRSLDRLFGISVPSIATWTTHHQLLHALNQHIYASLRLFALAALVWCLYRRQQRSAQRLLLASAYALAVVALVSIFLPGIGPWYNRGFLPLPNQIACEQTLLSLRAATPLALGSQDARIVCFPSFHVSLAFLSALALRPASRLVSTAALAWALLIAVSTVLLGWHYA